MLMSNVLKDEVELLSTLSVKCQKLDQGFPQLAGHLKIIGAQVRLA